MQHIQGISRNQLQMVSLEDKITPDNALRFIDAFVSVIDLKNLVFASSILKKPSGNGFILSRFLLDFCCFWFLEELCNGYCCCVQFDYASSSGN
jgi:hypothetical protein